MQKFIEIAGFEDELAGTMPDHLGIQLALMGHLLGHVANTSIEGEQLDSVLQLLDSYFGSHLTWPDKLFEIAAGRAETDFYRSLVRLTASFLCLGDQYLEECLFGTSTLEGTDRMSETAARSRRCGFGFGACCLLSLLR